MLAPLRAGRRRQAWRPAPRGLRGPGRRGGPLAALRVGPERVSWPGSSALGGRAAAPAPIGPGSRQSAQAPPRSAPAGRKRRTSARRPGRGGRGRGSGRGSGRGGCGRRRRGGAARAGPSTRESRAVRVAGLRALSRAPAPRSAPSRAAGGPPGSLAAGGRAADAAVRRGCFPCGRSARARAPSSSPSPSRRCAA